MCKGKKHCSCGCSSKKKQKLSESTSSLNDKLIEDYKILKNGEIVIAENDVEKEGYEELVHDGYLDYDTEVDRNEEGIFKKSYNYYYDYGNFNLSLEDFLSYFGFDDYSSEEPETKVFKAMEGGISESKQNINKELLIEKINLKLTINNKKEFLKQTRIALDALLSMYDLCEKINISNETVLNLVDKAFESTNELLTILVVQESIK